MQRQHTMILTRCDTKRAWAKSQCTRRKRRRHLVAMRIKLLGRHLLSSLEGVRGAYLSSERDLMHR